MIENFDLGGKLEPLEKSKHTAAGRSCSWEAAHFRNCFFLSNVCLTFSRLQISSSFFLRISLARGNLLTKFSKVSLAIKLGMKIWLEFVVWCFVLVLKIKTKRNGVPSLGFCCNCWEKVRFFKTKSLHLNTKAKNKRTANWNTDYIGARFAPKWGKFWDTLNERTKHLYLEGGDTKYIKACAVSFPVNTRARCHFCFTLSLALPRLLRLLCSCSRSCARLLITNITIRVFFHNLRENSCMLDST